MYIFLYIEILILKTEIIKLAINASFLAKVKIYHNVQ